MPSNSFNQAVSQLKKRKDRLGNPIISGGNKRWQITFRDTVSKGQSVATIHLVENWKLFNSIENDQKNHK